MSKKTITLSLILVGILLLSTLFYSKVGKSFFSSTDPSMDDSKGMI